MDEVLHISRDDLYQPTVDSTLAHAKAVLQHAQPIVEEHISPLRRLLLSPLFFTPLAGLLGGLTTWLILEPWIDDSSDVNVAAAIMFFPMTAVLIVVYIFIADALASRRFISNIGRWFSGVGFTVLFSFVAFLPVGMIFTVKELLLTPPDILERANITLWPSDFFIGYLIFRSLAWAVFGGALGLGMNLIKSTKGQRRASVMGGLVGGLLGGLLFDPINRFLIPSVEQGDVMRLVALSMVGLCVGIFVALSERLGRDGWIRVLTGPLRGKAFILYHNPTIIGAAPTANIYLFKDPKIAPEHIALHRAGNGYELVQTRNDAPVSVNNLPVHRRRLVSGDQIIVGDTILLFEERAKKRTPTNQRIREAKVEI
ncbi:MAG TPA: FHA domain-containing protein [Pyrinomonadaceae bacterium]|nr:FHA domain-containing protein [Pyrinomonadaceae bacterium]